MSDALEQAQRLNNLAGAVREYAGSVQSNLMCELLQALQDSYVVGLTHCQPDDLVRLQTSLRQCVALQNLLNGGQINGRV